MAKRKVVMKFPPALISEPLASKLVSDHRLVVNILRARVEPDEEGLLVAELSGREVDIIEGIKYAEGIGVLVEPLAQEVRWIEDRCTHCTACCNTCPTGALSVDRESMRVSFDSEKCIMCERCIKACPFGAMEIRF